MAGVMEQAKRKNAPATSLDEKIAKLRKQKKREVRGLSAGSGLQVCIMHFHKLPDLAIKVYSFGDFLYSVVLLSEYSLVLVQRILLVSTFTCRLVKQAPRARTTKERLRARTRLRVR